MYLLLMQLCLRKTSLPPPFWIFSSCWIPLTSRSVDGLENKGLRNETKKKCTRSKKHNLRSWETIKNEDDETEKGTQQNKGTRWKINTQKWNVWQYRILFFCHAMTCSQRVACHSQNRHLPQDLILCYLESNYLKFEKVKIVVQQSSWL